MTYFEIEGLLKSEESLPNLPLKSPQFQFETLKLTNDNSLKKTPTYYHALTLCESLRLSTLPCYVRLLKTTQSFVFKIYLIFFTK